MRDLFLIAVGGAVGALTRHSANLAAARWLGSQFPFGTLLVNVIGCFVIGMVAQLLANWEGNAVNLSPDMELRRSFLRYGVTVGFLGALTTFSSLGLETWRLGGDGALLAAVGNVLANLILGFVAVGLGIACIRGLS